MNAKAQRAQRAQRFWRGTREKLVVLPGSAGGVIDAGVQVISGMDAYYLRSL